MRNGQLTVRASALLQRRGQAAIVGLSNSHHTRRRQQKGRRHRDQASSVRRTFGRMHHVHVLQRAYRRCELFNHVARMRTITTRIDRKGDRHGLRTGQLSHGQGTVRRFKVAKRRINGVRFLHARTFTHAQRDNVRQGRLRLINAFGKEVELRQHSRVDIFLVIIDFSQARNGQQVPPVKMIPRNTRHAVSAIKEAGRRNLVLANTLLATTVLPLARLPANSSF